MLRRLPGALVFCLVLLITLDRATALDPTNDESAGRTLADWLADMESDDRQKRRDAIVGIGNLPRIDPKALPVLVGALEDEDAGVRSASLKVISSMGKTAQKALPGLVELMKREKSPKAIPYAMAIGRIGGPQAKVATRHLLILNAPKSEYSLLDFEYFSAFGNRVVKELLELLHDDSWRVRSRSARFLGKLNLSIDRKGTTELDLLEVTVQDLVTALRPLLKDERVTVRFHAAKAIARLEPKQATDAIPAIIEGVERKMMGSDEAYLIDKVASEAMPLLIQALAHEKNVVQYEFASIINRWPKLAMPHLLSGLASDQARIRAGSACAIGSFRFQKLFGPSQKEMREEAFKGLGLALEDSEAEVRLRSAESLLSLDYPKVEELLQVFIACLDDDSPDRRERAAEALGRIGAPAAPAIPALLRALRDGTFQVRIQAAIALPRIDAGQASLHANLWGPVFKETFLADESRFFFLQCSALQAVQKLGPSAVQLAPAMTARLSQSPNRENYVLQIELVKALVKVAPENAKIGVEKLVDLLPERETIHSYQRIQAIEALVQLGSAAKSTLPSLLEIMNDDDPKIAVQAAISSIRIDPMRSNRAWTFLRTAMTVNQKGGGLERRQRRLIAESVNALRSSENQEIAGAMVPQLTALLEVPDCHARSNIVRLLGSLGSTAKSAIPALKRLVLVGGYTSGAAKEAIGQISGQPAGEKE